MRRRTEQRAVIHRVMADAERPLDAHEILSRAQRQHPRLGIATVYRTIRLLLDEALIIAVELPNEPTRYERSGQGHHHHFQCEECGRVFDVPTCVRGIELGAPDGFEVRSHQVLLRGSCAECAR